MSKQEMHQSVVEVGTNICKNVDEAEKKLSFKNKIVELADKQNLIVGGAGTHPFRNGKTSP
jgi:carboxylate-amine ligase